MKIKKRLSPKQTEEAFEFVAKRDGVRCWYHGTKKRWKRKELILHHEDNNPENNPRDGTNWKLACRSHNHKLHPRGVGKFHPSRNLRIEDLRTSRPQTEEMRRNMKAKELFNEYFALSIEEEAVVDIDDICGYVSREGGVTCATVERYCNDMVRGNSPYYIDKDENCIRAHPVSAEPLPADNIEPEKTS